MARINERISECVSLQFTGGPNYRTDGVVLDNGWEVRNRRWLYPKHQYSAEFLNFSPAERDEVLRFIHAAAGSWLAFRFKDPMDYQANDEPLSPEIGTSTPVQMIKTYTAGGHYSERVVQAIVSATINANGSPVTGTMDMELGLFTPAAPWAAATYTWDGEFDVWVHFTQDYNPFTAADKNHWTAQITLEEDRQFGESES